MTRATYAELGDACAAAHAMELIGGRWTYPILRELVLGPKRFNALLASVFGLTPAVLTARLRELTAAGLVASAEARGAEPRSYALTSWAQELAPVLRDLGRWAQASPIRSSAGGLTPDAAVQAMITLGELVVPEQPVRIQLSLVDMRVNGAVEHHYLVEWTESGFKVECRPLTDAIAIVRCDSSTWARILFDGLEIEDTRIAITGDSAIAHRLIYNLRRGVI